MISEIKYVKVEFIIQRVKVHNSEKEKEKYLFININVKIGSENIFYQDIATIIAKLSAIKS